VVKFRIALISLGSKSSKMVVGALKKYFDKVDDINIRNIEASVSTGKLDVLYNGSPLEKYDGIYAKGSFRYEPLLKSITYALCESTYMPISPFAFSVGHDKLFTQLELQKYAIPMPKSYVVSTSELGKKVLEKINYPIIMKFPSGTQGKGVMYAESFAAASSMLDALATLKQPFIIQEYIETGGIDTRAIVVGDKVVASMKRKAVEGEKRANIHVGGKGEACILDAHTKNIAVKTAKIIGAEICAVDLLEGTTGPMVIEVNLSPGLQEITSATKINVADKIASYLYKKSKEFSEKGKKEKVSKILNDVGIKKAEKLKEIIANIDIRGNKILLPESVTNISKFKEKEEVTIEADEGKILIKK